MPGNRHNGKEPRTTRDPRRACRGAGATPAGLLAQLRPPDAGAAPPWGGFGEKHLGWAGSQSDLTGVKPYRALLHAGKFTAVAAIEAVNGQADKEPDEKAQPGENRQT